jgi:uncharacterized membrane protein YfcA
VSPFEVIAIIAAGLAAGTINAVVGSGTLITFPVLLAFGIPPVTANVSNNIGLVPGGVSGIVGYRRELSGQRPRIVRFAPWTSLGALSGAVLLLVLPAAAFKAIVPFFIVIALALILLQPRIGPPLAARAARHGGRTPAWARPAVFATGIYGGYFGAAQGIMLLAALGLAIPDDLQRINALKNVLGTMANFVAATVFVFAAHVDWTVVALIAGGSVVGGQIGSRYGRRLPPEVLRVIIVIVGITAIVRLIA